MFESHPNKCTAIAAHRSNNCGYRMYWQENTAEFIISLYVLC